MTVSRPQSEILTAKGKICSQKKDDLLMSLSLKGLNAKVESRSFLQKVSNQDIYIKLVNTIDWPVIRDLALPDLENTEKGFYWLGRKINLRTHLSVMILQSLQKETDRGIVELIKFTPRFQAFCGRGIIPEWKCPDHTAIEKFRNRLQPETHKKIGDYILQVAYQLGLANPTWMDLDSTTQEANIAYPSDANLMRKLSLKCKKVLDFLKEKGKKYLPLNLNIDIKKINNLSKEYFFLAKNIAIEKKRNLFASYHKLVKSELKNFIYFSKTISPQGLINLPWNIQKSIIQIKKEAWKYLLDVGHFIRTNTMKKGKILSFHCKQVVCISKKKAGKEREFGRTFQLGRIGGNFLIPFTCSDVRMVDKHNLIPSIEEHKEIFGGNILKSIGCDKGYFSYANVLSVEKMGINGDGIQRPGNIKSSLSEDVTQPLRHRRAGIEPLIGHAKIFGLGKSRMKSDNTTLASGYRSIMGFNLHQIKRKMEMKMEKKVA